MKNIIILSVGVVLLVAVVIGSVSSGSVLGSQSETVKVGVLLPQTGTFPWWGEIIMNGVKSAEAEGYTQGIEFIYADTQCDPKTAVTETQRLKAQYPDMHMFLVGCDSDLKAMTPVLDPKKDIAFVAGLSGADLYDTDVRIVNLAYRLEVEAAAVAEYATTELEVKKVGIIHGNNTFGAVLGTAIPAELAKRGAVGITEELQINDTHPETAVLKILAQKPDAIYLHNDIPTVAALLKRIRQSGFTGPVLAMYAAHDQSLIDAAGGAAEGLILPWPVPEHVNEEGEKFKARYATYSENDPFVTAYFIYDGLMLLSSARAECSADAQCIADYFFAEDSFDGTLGPVTYRANGEVDRTFEFQKIENGEFVSAE